MMTKIWTSLLVSATLLAACKTENGRNQPDNNQAKDNIPPCSINLQAGDVAYLQFDQLIRIETTGKDSITEYYKMDETYRFSPQQISDNGTVHYLVELTENKVSISRGDSTISPRQIEASELHEEMDMNTYIQNIGLLKSYARFELWMDSSGAITRLAGIDRYYADWLENTTLSEETKTEMLDKLKKSGGNINVMSWLNRELCYQTDTIMHTGMTWEQVLIDPSSMPNEYTYTWQLMKTDGDTAWLKAKIKRRMVFANPNFQSTGQGIKTLRVDMRTGWIIDGKMDYVINNKLERGMGEGFESVLNFQVKLKGYTE